MNTYASMSLSGSLPMWERGDKSATRQTSENRLQPQKQRAVCNPICQKPFMKWIRCIKNVNNFLKAPNSTTQRSWYFLTHRSGTRDIFSFSDSFNRGAYVTDPMAPVQLPLPLCQLIQTHNFKPDISMYRRISLMKQVAWEFHRLNRWRTFDLLSFQACWISTQISTVTKTAQYTGLNSNIHCTSHTVNKSHFYLVEIFDII